MRMYWAAVVGLLAAFCWPERNVAEVPFAELTLKLIAGTAIALWLAYHAVKLAFSSLEKDDFWPWRWTKAILLMLALRTGWILAYFAILWFFASFTKLGPWLNDSPIIVGIISFCLVTFAVCADDADIRGIPVDPNAAASDVNHQ